MRLNKHAYTHTQTQHKHVYLTESRANLDRARCVECVCHTQRQVEPAFCYRSFHFAHDGKDNNLFLYIMQIMCTDAV